MIGVDEERRLKIHLRKKMKRSETPPSSEKPGLIFSYSLTLPYYFLPFTRLANLLPGLRNRVHLRAPVPRNSVQSASGLHVGRRSLELPRRLPHLHRASVPGTVRAPETARKAKSHFYSSEMG